MKKYFFIILQLAFFSNLIFSNVLQINNLLSLDLKNIKAIKISERIFVDNDDENNRYMIKYGFILINEKKRYNLYTYLRPNKVANIENIKSYTNISELTEASTSFGMGDIYKFFFEEKSNVTLVNKDNITIRKYISDWGTEVSRDILAYNFELKNNPIFDNCIIEIYDVWGDKGEELPNNFNTKFVEEEIKKGNKKAEFYKIIDDIILNIKILDSNSNDKSQSDQKNYLTSKIDNLRFRETPTLDGKFIRMLNKGEQLELLEKGKEETISGTKGSWVKVKTEKGEVGWCFDAYLEEVKKK